MLRPEHPGASADPSPPGPGACTHPACQAARLEREASSRRLRRAFHDLQNLLTAVAGNLEFSMVCGESAPAMAALQDGWAASLLAQDTVLRLADHLALTEGRGPRATRFTLQDMLDALTPSLKVEGPAECTQILACRELLTRSLRALQVLARKVSEEGFVPVLRVEVLPGCVAFSIEDRGPTPAPGDLGDLLMGQGPMERPDPLGDLPLGDLVARWHGGSLRLDPRDKGMCTTMTLPQPCQGRAVAPGGGA